MVEGRGLGGGGVASEGVGRGRVFQVLSLGLGLDSSLIRTLSPDSGVGILRGVVSHPYFTYTWMESNLVEGK